MAAPLQNCSGKLVIVNIIYPKSTYELKKSARGLQHTRPTFFGFPANDWPNSDVFKPKTICITRGTIHQNFSLLESAVSEELGNKQTHKFTHWHSIAFIE